MATVAGLIQIMGWAVEAVALGKEVLTVVRASRDALNTMIEENRNPTKEEFDSLLKSVQQRQDRIRNA